MRVAIYARVSTQRQAHAQVIAQQVMRLQAYVTQMQWRLTPYHVYLDEGYSGSTLKRPGLDRLRDAAALADLDVILVTAPDRLARKYVHQVLLLEEFQRAGCQVEFLDRPMSQDPNDQLLLQIRGAVAEYERTLITERMRRGRLAKLRAGQLLPWVRVPFGYQVDPARPRDPRGLQVHAYTAVVVQQIFAWYLEPRATLLSIARRLNESGIATPRGKTHWATSTLRELLQNPAYIGTAYGNCTHLRPARGRRSPLLPVGSGFTCSRRPAADWIPVEVPAIVTPETFGQVQQKLKHNQQMAGRNNTRHQYLLRAVVSCGECRLGAVARTTWDGYGYYVCRGNSAMATQARRCHSRHIPVSQLDALVWQDLCAVLTQPQLITTALRRAHSGQWFPQELQARLRGTRAAITTLERHQQRLLEAYLSEVLDLAAFTRKRQEIAQRLQALGAQQHHLTTTAQQRIELATVAQSIKQFCAQVRCGLAKATFTQQRALVELLIDRVIVTREEVEIRHAVPTTAEGPHRPFCQLRTDYLHGLPGGEVLWEQPPRAPAAEQVENRIKHLAHVGRAGPSAGLGRWNQRSQHGPLLITQIRGVRSPIHPLNLQIPPFQTPSRAVCT